MERKDYGVFDDVLARAAVASWKIEVDEGAEPRMYGDATLRRLLGVAEDAVLTPEQLYHAWYDHVDPDHYDAVAEGVSCMLNNELAEIEYPWHHPDGRVIVVRCGGIRDNTYTKGARAVGIHQWVTTMKHVDREFEAQQRQLKRALALVDGLSREYHTVWIIDGRTHAISLYRTTGVTTAAGTVEYGKQCRDYDDGIDWYVRNFVDAEDQERVRRETAWDAVVKNTPDVGIYSVTYKRHPAPGKTDHHQMCFAKSVSPSGETDYIFAYRDVDAIVRNQIEAEARHGRELEQALEQARQASRSKTAFLFNMSHDIRTPMNAIAGFTAIAKKSVGDPAKVVDCLGKIESAGALLMSLINNILDMSRVESGNVKPEEVVGDVMLSFDAIKLTMGELAEEKGVSLSFEFGEIRNRFVYADFDRCNRVFVNLISNAIKYSRPNGWVKVRCEEVGDKSGSGDSHFSTYRYTFADNGIGMSEEFQRHVFEEFSRERNSTTSGIQGTGLGLALCKSFIELLGGSISCESKQGVGTTFTIEVPFRLQDRAEYVDPETGAVKSATTNEEVAPLNLGPGAFKGKRVLLVEDNAMNREVAVFVLEGQGMEVTSAEDGSVAVRLVKEMGLDAFDYILMDIQMPIMGGYEATRILRDLGFRRPIIALSANAFAEDKAASIAAGMDDHVAKPIKVKDLFLALASSSRE